MTFRCAALLVFLLIRASSYPQAARSSEIKPEPEPACVPIHKFDSKRDAAADIQAGVAEAHRTGKRVIVDVGGDWCQYCHQLDQLFQEHPDLL